MVIRDIHKSDWCVEGRHARCQGRRICNCACHLTPHDFAPSVTWAYTANRPALAHMQRGFPHRQRARPGKTRTECGIWARAGVSLSAEIPSVCPRCLKATEKVIIP